MEGGDVLKLSGRSLTRETFPRSCLVCVLVEAPLTLQTGEQQRADL